MTNEVHIGQAVGNIVGNNAEVISTSPLRTCSIINALEAQGVNVKAPAIAAPHIASFNMASVGDFDAKSKLQIQPHLNIAPNLSHS